jgi:lipoate-protein ligase A
VCSWHDVRGGGAVYHDLGNINFTFFSPRSNYNKEGNFAIVTAALAHYAIPACATERNDILVETNKVSGSAFKLKSDKAYHHGTLLVETDLDNLAYYLEPPASQMETRGTASVRSPVANIKTFCPGLDREQLSERIIEEFFRMHGHEGPVITVSEEEAFGMDGIQEACDRYSRWDWCLGKTPRFTNMLHGTFPWGYIDVWIRTNRGIIEQVSMDSDVLEAGLTEALAESMQGACYRRDAIRERCEKLKNTFRQRQGHLDQLMYWLQESL